MRKYSNTYVDMILCLWFSLSFDVHDMWAGGHANACSSEDFNANSEDEWPQGAVERIGDGMMPRSVECGVAHMGNAWLA